MPTYAVEVYAQRLSESDLSELVTRLRLAADKLSMRGTAVRHVEAVFMPEDEVCFHIFKGASPASVAAVMERADVPFERVIEAIAPEVLQGAGLELDGIAPAVSAKEGREERP